MSRKELIEQLIDLENGELAEKIERIERNQERIESKLDFLLSAVVVRQKEACEIIGITEATARNMALRGDFEPLQTNGGKANYLTLATTAELKPRRQAKRKKLCSK